MHTYMYNMKLCTHTIGKHKTELTKTKIDTISFYFSFGAKFLFRRGTVALFASIQEEQIG